VTIGAKRVRMTWGGFWNETQEAKVQRQVTLPLRMVFTEGWPDGTTEATVMKKFPTAEGVMLRMDGERFMGRAAVYFATPQAAKEAARKYKKGGVFRQWGGNPKYMAKPQRPVMPRMRALLTNGWPYGTTEVFVKAIFPLATAVVLDGKGEQFTGRALLVFATASAAKEAATRRVTVGVNRLQLMWGGFASPLRTAAQKNKEVLARTMHSGEWPPKTAEKKVRKVFPSAINVKLQMDHKRFTGNALVEFATVNAAKNAAELKTTVGQNVLRLRWLGTESREEAGPREGNLFPFGGRGTGADGDTIPCHFDTGPDSEDVVRRMGRIGRIERERTVYIELCPSGVEPKQLFPSIQSVTPVEPKGTTALMFATAEEAKRVAGMVPTKVFGSRWVRLSWGGAQPRVCTLITGKWPQGTTEAMVLEKFTSAHSALLHFTGTTFSGWAVVCFPRKKNAQRAAATKTNVGGSPLTLKWGGVSKVTPAAKAHERKERLSRAIHASKWPKNTSEAAVWKVFPKATAVTLRMDGKRFTGEALVEFATTEGARRAAAKETEFRGIALRLRWAGNGAQRGLLPEGPVGLWNKNGQKSTKFVAKNVLEGEKSGDQCRHEERRSELRRTR